MPIFTYFAVAGTLLVGLLFTADAMLVSPVQPLNRTSSFYGLPPGLQGKATAMPLVATPAPEPDMASAAVLAAAPPSPAAAPAPAEIAAAKPAKRKHARRRDPQFNDGQGFGNQAFGHQGFGGSWQQNNRWAQRNGSPSSMMR